MLANQTYNKDFLEFHPKGIMELLILLLLQDIKSENKKRHTIRLEMQNLTAKQLEHAEEDEDGDKGKA